MNNPNEIHLGIVRNVYGNGEVFMTFDDDGGVAVHQVQISEVGAETRAYGDIDEGELAIYRDAYNASDVHQAEVIGLFENGIASVVFQDDGSRAIRLVRISELSLN